MSNLIIRISDTHYNLSPPWAKYKHCSHINDENPDKLIHTGDISNGFSLKSDLEYLGSHIKCPIYFVRGNHESQWSSFAKSAKDILEICNKYPNLHWLNRAEEDPIQLSEDGEVGLIGVDGWYDGNYGDRNLLKYSFDWILIKELRHLSSMKIRYDFFVYMAEESAKLAKKKLEKALEKFKLIYLATHFPPFKGSERSIGTYMEPYWLAYNVNKTLGDEIVKIMNKNKKRQLVVLAGHSHKSIYIQVARNISCIVAEARYTETTKHEDKIYV